MKCRLRPLVALGSTLGAEYVKVISVRAVRSVVICCVVATALSCDQSRKEHGAADTAGSSTALRSVTEPPAKMDDAAALVPSREEWQPLLVEEAEQRLPSSSIKEVDIITRLASQNVSYSDFLQYADDLAHPQPPESPDVWLKIANNPDRDHRIRTIALFLFFRRHVATPLTIHDLYHSDPYQQVLPSMKHTVVKGGNAIGYFVPAGGIPDGILILRTDYLTASYASVLLALSGDGISWEGIDALLSDTSGRGKRYVCTEVALVINGLPWPGVPPDPNYHPSRYSPRSQYLGKEKPHGLREAENWPWTEMLQW